MELYSESEMESYEISSIRSREAVAIDCEMVGGGSDCSLDLCARVCLVNEDEKLIFHTYVLPQIPVTNYRYLLANKHTCLQCQVTVLALHLFILPYHCVSGMKLLV